MPEQKSIDAKIIKLDEEQQLVFGWASVTQNLDGTELVDRQGDVIKIETLEKAAYDFVLNSRVAGEMHRKIGVGKLVESVVMTKNKQRAMGLADAPLPDGWWVGFKIDRELFEKVKSGEYDSFSIGGIAERV